jgi:hypothetical protein
MTRHTILIVHDKILYTEKCTRLQGTYVITQFKLMRLLNSYNWLQGNAAFSDLNEASPNKAEKGKRQKGIQLCWRYQVKRN